MNDILNTIFQRRSIRRYKAQPVEQEKLIQLLQAAMAAPNACNSQPWEFVVVTEPERMNALRSVLRAGPYNAPAAIAVCGNPSKANNSCGKQYWVQDCSAALENMLIAAVGMGLGTVWIGVYPLPSVIQPISQVLCLPEEVTPLGVVYVGYPDEVKPARTQYDDYYVHWQQYEPKKKRAKIKNAKYQ